MHSMAKIVPLRIQNPPLNLAVSNAGTHLKLFLISALIFVSPSGNKFMRILGTYKSLLYNCMATTCYIYQLCVVFPKSSLFLMQNHQILTIARWNVRYHVRIFSIIHISEFHVWSPLSIFCFMSGNLSLSSSILWYNRTNFEWWQFHYWLWYIFLKLQLSATMVIQIV